jgi:hypothetical protein
MEQLHRVLSNYKFYADAIVDFSSPHFHKDNNFVLQNIGKDFFPEHMISSTPTISYGRDFNELIIVVRFVNYKINEFGQYIQQSTITSSNVIASVDISNPLWKLNYDATLSYDTSYDHRYIGIEDIRILRRTSDNSILYTYSSNRCGQDGNWLHLW